MDADRFMTRLNPLILAILRSPLHFLLSRGLMRLTFTGRKSGKTFSIPVGYQRRGEVITVIVSKAWRKQWWRNFREPSQVSLDVRGSCFAGVGRLVAKDDPRFERAFEITFSRVPPLPGQFGITDYRKGEPLNTDQLSLIRDQGQLVLIDIS
jgi:hypothetical protein